MTTNSVRECPICESTRVAVQRVTIRQAFKLPAVTLENVERLECKDCGEGSTAFPQHGLLMRQIRLGLCHIGRVLTSSEFAFLRSGLGMSQSYVSEIMGVSNVTVSRWETGASSISEQTDLLLRILTLEALEYSYSIEELVAARSHARRTFSIDVEDFADGMLAFEFTQPIVEFENDWEVGEIRLVA